MGLRFQKRVPVIGRVVWLNASKNGFSVSIGFRGFFSLNIGKQGIIGSLNIPISGASYRKKLINFKRKKEVLSESD